MPNIDLGPYTIGNSAGSSAVVRLSDSLTSHFASSSEAVVLLSDSLLTVTALTLDGATGVHVVVKSSRAPDGTFASSWPSETEAGVDWGTITTPVTYVRAGIVLVRDYARVDWNWVGTPGAAAAATFSVKLLANSVL